MHNLFTTHRYAFTSLAIFVPARYYLPKQQSILLTLIYTQKIMRKFSIVTFILFSILEIQAQTYEYKIVTSIESVVPMGVGRSRIISAEETKDHTAYTTSRSEENTKQNKSKRSDAKVENFDETKMLNFYSATGINFQNVASNDALLSSKVNSMIEKGWELTFVTSAVESDAGKGDGDGIFITRFIFRRMK